jgi:glucuronate isomerase
MKPIDLHPDRLFPADPATRALARALYATVEHLPIVSPHGHTDPQWFADDPPFQDASALFITPDHYVFRMLYSQGVRLEDLGIRRRDGAPVEEDARRIWHRFAAHYPLFRGTPTRLWLDHAFRTVFGMEERLTTESADRYFDRINAMLATPAFRRARCSSASASRSSPPRSRRSTRSSITAGSARAAGRGASSPPTGPTPSSIPSSRASPRTSLRSAS